MTRPVVRTPRYSATRLNRGTAANDARPGGVVPDQRTQNLNSNARLCTGRGIELTREKSEQQPVRSLPGLKVLCVDFLLEEKT